MKIDEAIKILEEYSNGSEKISHPDFFDEFDKAIETVIQYHNPSQSSAVRYCDNCAYRDVQGHIEPCRLCFNYEKWEAR